MSKREPQSTSSEKERAYLVGVKIQGQNDLLTIEDSLAELALLADTAGLQVVGSSWQKLNHPNVQTYIGKGKVEEIRLFADDVAAQVILFDDELSPRHLRELERIFGDKVRILDRTALILDIFAQHAHTREGALQVELAQYEYRLPRLTGAWTHLARQAGGGGGRSGSVGGVGLRGPGETQLEVDRRDIKRRIDHLKRELEKVRSHRKQYRIRRKQSQIPSVALVGYTNAGKSTLLNRISSADVFVADQLFATLDPTTRRVDLPGGNQVLITDTVGFIQKLPTDLVAAFRATLEEIAESDLLLHIIDITHINAVAQAKAVYQTLEEIGASHIPVIPVFNKVDNLLDPERAKRVLVDFQNAMAISALKGDGIDDLLETINEELYEKSIPIEVKLPYTEGNLISIFHEYGQVEKVENFRGGVLIKGNIPGRFITSYEPYAHRDGDQEIENLLDESDDLIDQLNESDEYD